jgi:transposase-like protein
VLCVETIGKIRRRRLVQGESISAIARDLGLSRNTVKRALRSEGERFEYRRSSQPRPKLGVEFNILWPGFQESVGVERKWGPAISAPHEKIQTSRENVDSPPDKHLSACRLEARREIARDNGLPLGSSASVAFCSIDD